MSSKPENKEVEMKSSPRDSVIIIAPKAENGKNGKKEKVDKTQMVTYGSLYRYATFTDKVMMVIGVICAAANGTVMPLYAVLLGNLINALVVPAKGQTHEESVRPYAIDLILLGIAAFVVSMVSFSFWSITAQRQVKIIRNKYLSSVLRQDIAWFDHQSPGELAARIGTDSTQIQNAIGESVPAVAQNISRFLTGMIIAFVYGWQLALVVLAVSPLLVMVTGVFSKFITTVAVQSSKAYGDAGAVAEESITAMRTVAASNAEERETQRFNTQLLRYQDYGEKRSVFTGVMVGTLLFFMFGTYSISYWFGAQLIIWGSTNARTGNNYTGGDVVSTFFSLMIGSFSLGQLGPYIPDFSIGRGAGFRVFQIIDRKPEIDASGETGEVPAEVKGRIEFRDIQFAYPTRKEMMILKGVNFEIQPGQTVALVGESGSGKSTCIGLLERYYDPLGGTVFIDGKDLSKVNLKYWREHVGLVGQQPLLFRGTIRENILYGKHDGTMDDVVEASKAANAHKFITSLPDAYETYIGGFGSEFLSGGQKQRIAIARALIRKPKVLLLDEATSALDNESEKIVQKALDELMTSELSKGMTTFVIAHRLSTIRNADVILVFDKGVVVERGTHAELMERRGTYYALVKSQDASATHGEDEKAESPTEEVVNLPQTTVVPADKKRRGSKSTSRKIVAATNDREHSKSAQTVPMDPTSIVSAVAVDEDKEAEEVEVEDPEMDYPRVPIRRVWKYISPNVGWLIIGIIGATGSGIVQPVFAIIMSGMISIFYSRDLVDLKAKAAEYAGYFILIAAGQFLVSLGQITGLGKVGERLTTSIRRDMFGSIMRQEIGWFDNPKNSAGILSMKINLDAENIRKITVDWVGQIFQIVLTSFIGFGLAYYYDWRMALVLTAISPMLLLAGFGQIVFMNQKGKAVSFEIAGQLASEAIAGIHTVISFTSEGKILESFDHVLQGPLNDGVKHGLITGVAVGGSEIGLFLSYGIALWYGGYLLDQGLITYTHVLNVFFVIVLSLQSIGRIAEKTPDFQKAVISLRSCFALIDRKSAIDPLNNEGDAVERDQRLSIKFDKVRFRYPTRPDALVFKQLSLEIKPGQTVALVGFSGSGKSTVIQLLERYYDPEGGEIQINGQYLSRMNVSQWRSRLGLVSQEPILFNLSILENIRYANPKATDEEVIECAKKANIYDFVMKQPDQFHTVVGPRGGQLSGGQRQRIAIARAILRDPEILLLDEATSALDNESEKLVQDALEVLMQNRTTVVIAHRLSTVQHADMILVMSDGQVVESGNHQQLLAMNGVYASLVAAGLGEDKKKKK